LGKKVIVHADHLNILYGKLSNDRITRWILLVEEYGPKYVHIAGKNNIVADALSRLKKNDDEPLYETEEGLVLSHAMCAVEQDEAIVIQDTKEELVMNIMNFDEMESEEFIMSPEIISREQQKDSQLKELMKRTHKFSERNIERSTVITYENKIYISQSLRNRIVWWYNTYLHHPGITRTEATLRQNLTWPNIRKDLEAAVKNCHECQIGKKTRNKYGELPYNLAQRRIAWNRVDVDLIGPLTINNPTGKK
jgi:hypothetical protein